MIRDAASRGTVLNETGARIPEGTDLYWLKDHQFKKGQKAWNSGKTGVFSEETLNKMRIAKLRKPALKIGGYTDADRQTLRDAQPSSKAIICIETGVTYQSISLAATALKLNRADVRKVLQGKRKNCGGYTFAYVVNSVG